MKLLFYSYRTSAYFYGASYKRDSKDRDKYIFESGFNGVQITWGLFFLNNEDMFNS